MRKFPLFGRGAGEDAQNGPKGLNKRWKHYLAAALALLVVAVMVTTCSLGGSSRSPLAKSSVPTAGLSTTPTSDTTAALLATPGAGTTATAQPGGQPTAGTGRQPTTQPGGQPTAGPGAQPTTQPGVQPTAGPGGQPTPPPTGQPTPTPTAQPVPVPTPTAQPVPTPTPTPTPISGASVTVWIQVTDSCRQALPGGTFSVSGPGVSTITAPTGGSYGSVPTGGGCPIPHGTCASGNGCTTAVLPVPTSGSLTYTVTIYGTAPGVHGRNVRYAVCEGGSDCPHGPERATVQVNANGTVSATTLNIYPDGVPITYGSFTASQADPIMFHEFGIAGDTSVQCDNDSDLDDYLTGTPGSHCDSDKGNPNH